MIEKEEKMSGHEFYIHVAHDHEVEHVAEQSENKLG
jgi:hypothetical protein